MNNLKNRHREFVDNNLRCHLSWKGTTLFDFMKEYQPERFEEKKRDGTLIPFLSRVASDWEARMKEHQNNGLTFAEANELEHELLMEMAGFMN